MKQKIAASRILQSHAARVLMLFLPVALLICAVAIFVRQTTLDQIHADHLRKEQETVLAGAASINDSLQTIVRDLQFLAARFKSRQLVDGNDPQQIISMADEWITFSQAHRIYDKIRWIDETGKERLRVNYAHPHPFAVPPDQLQNKLDRYFFVETMKRNAGEIFVSPLDLNIDNDRLETPRKPTIRVGMTVFDNTDKPRGILLINYAADALLDRFDASSAFRGRGDWLVNTDGYWLRGEKPEDEFGFMFSRDDLTMEKRHPEAWAKIRNEESGQFETADGLWTFATVRPLPETRDATDKIRASDRYVWKTISYLPRAEFSTDTGKLDLSIAGSASLLLLLFLIATWRMTRAQMLEDDMRVNLSRNEARLRSLVQTIPDLIWLKNQDGVYLSCNPAFERLYGAKENEIVGKTDYDFVDAELADFFRDNDQAAIDSPTARNNEEWLTFADDGHRALMETTKIAVKTASGEIIGVLGIARDITERKSTEDELRRNNYLITNLTSHVPGLIYQYRLDADGQGSFPFVSEAVKDMYGLTPQEVYDDPHALFSFAHPDDLDDLNKSIMESARTLQDWRHEYRVSLPKLGLRWLMGHSIPEKQEDGSIIWYGFITDVTDRKISEEGLQLAAMVYECSTEGIVVTNVDNTIIAINPAFEKTTGYSSNEVIGQNPRILKSGRHEQDFYEAMWELLRNTGHWQGELWNKRKDDSFYMAWLTISTIYNDDKSVRYYVALSSDITERKESEKLIWQQANFDALTGLPNRNMFREHLVQDIRKSHRSGLPMALLLLDLDHFKDVNDTLGHDMGDIMLQEAARRLRSCVRDSDIVARIGGDEFTVILGDVHDHGMVDRVAQNILQKMSDPFELKGELVHISASAGITFYPDDATEIEDLLKNADQAMYAAKKHGRNRSHYFAPSMQEAAQTRMRLISDLRAVLNGNQFTLHYQPIVKLADGTIHKAEALIRWHHPLRGLINPADFIPIAEETGMIIDIGDWVFREASKQAAYWRKMHHPDFQISINMSAVQFRNDGGMFNAWLDHLRELGLNGQSMVVEITESLLLDAASSVSKDLITFRDAGIQVAIDDFGTGYSSLAYLKKFDIDYIKIDQSFITNLAAGSDDMALCEAIIMMAHKLGMKVIAEGVETEAQRDLLLSIDCDYAQGFLFSRPLTPISFDTLLQSTNAA